MVSGSNARAAGLAVISCVVLGACSSTASSSSNSAANGAGAGGGSANSVSITKSDWIAKADAICKATATAENQQMTAAAKALPAGSSPAQIDALVAKIIAPSIDTALAKLRALGYPAGEKAKLESIYHGFEAVNAQLRADPVKAVTQNLNRAGAAAFRAYGATECGKFSGS